MSSTVVASHTKFEFTPCTVHWHALVSVPSHSVRLPKCRLTHLYVLTYTIWWSFLLFHFVIVSFFARSSRSWLSFYIVPPLNSKMTVVLTPYWSPEEGIQKLKQETRGEFRHNLTISKLKFHYRQGKLQSCQASLHQLSVWKPNWIVTFSSYALSQLLSRNTVSSRNSRKQMLKFFIGCASSTCRYGYSHVERLNTTHDPSLIHRKSYL